MAGKKTKIVLQSFDSVPISHPFDLGNRMQQCSLGPTPGGFAVPDECLLMPEKETKEVGNP